MPLKRSDCVSLDIASLSPCDGFLPCTSPPGYAEALFPALLLIQCVTLRSCTPFCFSHQYKEGDIFCKSPSWCDRNSSAEIAVHPAWRRLCYVWPAHADAAPLTLLCVLSLPAAAVHEPGAPEQHGPADPEWLFLHQPLQHGARAEQRHGPLALRPAQLHF